MSGAIEFPSTIDETMTTTMKTWSFLYDTCFHFFLLTLQPDSLCIAGLGGRDQRCLFRDRSGAAHRALFLSIQFAQNRKRHVVHPDPVFLPVFLYFRICFFLCLPIVREAHRRFHPARLPRAQRPNQISENTLGALVGFQTARRWRSPGCEASRRICPSYTIVHAIGWG